MPGENFPTGRADWAKVTGVDPHGEPIEVEGTGLLRPLPAARGRPPRRLPVPGPADRQEHARGPQGGQGERLGRARADLDARHVTRTRSATERFRQPGWPTGGRGHREQVVHVAVGTVSDTRHRRADGRQVPNPCPADHHPRGEPRPRSDQSAGTADRVSADGGGRQPAAVRHGEAAGRQHQARQAPGGLVTALAPILSRRQGAWIGWPGHRRRHRRTDQDRRAEPASGRRCPAKRSRTTTRASPTSTLWPLYHDAVVDSAVPPRVVGGLLSGERAVRRDGPPRSRRPGATVWVHDYQLQLVPQLLRELRPDVRIGFFLHIPFPPVELFMRLPWRTQIIAGPARRRPDRVPAARWRTELRPAGASAGRRDDHGRLHRVRRAARSGPARSRSPSTRRRSARWRRHPGDARRPPAAARDLGDPQQDHPRRRSAGLHQGHRRPAAGVRGAARRGRPGRRRTR